MMKAHPKRQVAKQKTEPDIELRPDGWERFERAVGAAAKSGPKHRPAAKSKARLGVRLKKIAKAKPQK
jgi:hypothetical protein